MKLGEYVEGFVPLAVGDGKNLEMLDRIYATNSGKSDLLSPSSFADLKDKWKARASKDGLVIIRLDIRQFIKEAGLNDYKNLFAELLGHSIANNSLLDKFINQWVQSGLLNWPNKSEINEGEIPWVKVAKKGGIGGLIGDITILSSAE
jgi:hypothetical protein